MLVYLGPGNLNDFLELEGDFTIINRVSPCKLFNYLFFQ